MCYIPSIIILDCNLSRMQNMRKRHSEYIHHVFEINLVC